jgi:hypothetical protein
MINISLVVYFELNNESKSTVKAIIVTIIDNKNPIFCKLTGYVSIKFVKNKVLSKITKKIAVIIINLDCVEFIK